MKYVLHRKRVITERNQQKISNATRSISAVSSQTGSMNHSNGQHEPLKLFATTVQRECASYVSYLTSGVRIRKHPPNPLIADKVAKTFSAKQADTTT